MDFKIKNTLESKINSYNNELNKINQLLDEQKARQIKNEELIEKQEDFLKKYSEKIENKELSYNKIAEKCKEKNDELESLISYLNVLKNDSQNEKMYSNNLKVIN